jgi:hypothetical protein
MSIQNSASIAVVRNEEIALQESPALRANCFTHTLGLVEVVPDFLVKSIFSVFRHGAIKPPTLLMVSRNSNTHSRITAINNQSKVLFSYGSSYTATS